MNLAAASKRLNEDNSALNFKKRTIPFKIPPTPKRRE